MFVYCPLRHDDNEAIPPRKIYGFLGRDMAESHRRNRQMVFRDVSYGGVVEVHDATIHRLYMNRGTNVWYRRASNVGRGQ